MAVCLECCREYQPSKHAAGHQKYCSACRRIVYNRRRRENRRKRWKPVKLKCAWCGAEFLKKRFGPTPRYCSEKCQKACHTYHYHNKVRFGGNRYVVLARDGYRCRYCGTTKNLIVHHLDWSGQTDNPNHSIDNLITLCRACHARVHHDGAKNTKYKHISKEAIEEAIASSKNLDEAAAKLGITRKTLLKKRKLYGLPLLDRHGRPITPASVR